MKRRNFFQTTAFGIAGLSLASCKISNNGNTGSTPDDRGRSAVGGPSYRKNLKSTFSKSNLKSANDRIIVAIIGVGGYGNKLIQEAVTLNKNIQVKYVCDVDDTRGGKTIIDIEKVQGVKPIRVRDMRKVYDDKEVDAVFIATPEHWHALATIWACQAGKDVYVEKCISHNLFEGQKMIEAAMKYERVVQCGMQNRSADYALTARDYIESGELGDLVSVHIRELETGPIPFRMKEDTNAPDTIDWDLWLGPAPKVPYNISRNKSWGYFWDYAGGLAMSNGIIHQLDMTRLILDKIDFPKSVYCAGGRYFYDDQRDIPDYQMAILDYENFLVTLETGQCTPYMEKTNNEIRYGGGFPEWSQNTSRVLIQGTKKMMYVGRMGGGWQVFDKKNELVAQQEGYFPRIPHIENFIDCIRTRENPNGDIVEGHKSSALIHLTNASYRVGSKQLIFDPETEMVLNNEKANEILSGSYRKGFEIPDKV